MEQDLSTPKYESEHGSNRHGRPLVRTVGEIGVRSMCASRIPRNGELEVSRTQLSTPSSGLEKNENGLLRLVPFRPDSGKRKKVGLVKNETESSGGVLYQQFGNISRDGSVRLAIVAQPEVQHRARYLTEGSRGAIKDREGLGHPAVRLEGYTSPVTIEIYIGNDTGKVVPHMFYQACRVTGKNSFPCTEKKIEGTDVIDLHLDPGVDMVLVCDCVGILKERFADVEARFPKHKTWKTTKKKSTKCRLVFRTTIVNQLGETEVLQVASDVINCTQLPGTPEILRLSTLTSPVSGGGELWMIGKNFLKDTKVIFSYSVAGKKEPLWTNTCDPEPEFLQQSHLITKIPSFVNEEADTAVEVSLFIKCGDKISDSMSFTYTPLPKTEVKEKELNLLKGVSAPAVAINEQFAKSGSINMLRLSEQAESVTRPTILEPIHDHNNKKSRLDYSGRSALRRARSVPRSKSISRPHLVNEDTLFESHMPLANNTAMYTNFSQAPMLPWNSSKLASSLEKGQPQPTSVLLLSRPRFPKPLITKRSFSIEDEDSLKSEGLIIDEASCNSRGDHSSSLTSDFSNVFSFSTPVANTSGTTVSFSGFKIQPSQGETGINTFSRNSWSDDPLLVTSPLDEKPQECAPQKVQENVALSEGTDEDKATISISLPSSILKNKKHFQNVMDTINNTLLNGGSPPSNEIVESRNFSEIGLSETQNQNYSPNGSVSSVPVSVLSLNRKRNFSNEQEQVNYPAVEQASNLLAGDIREQKWNNEFNDALQTVIEEKRAEAEASAISATMDWNQEKMKSTGMGWINPTTAENKNFFEISSNSNMSQVESVFGMPVSNPISTQSSDPPPSSTFPENLILPPEPEKQVSTDQKMIATILPDLCNLDNRPPGNSEKFANANTDQLISSKVSSQHLQSPLGQFISSKHMFGGSDGSVQRFAAPTRGQEFQMSSSTSRFPLSPRQQLFSVLQPPAYSPQQSEHFSSIQSSPASPYPTLASSAQFPSSPYSAISNSPEFNFQSGSHQFTQSSLDESRPSGTVQGQGAGLFPQSGGEVSRPTAEHATFPGNPGEAVLLMDSCQSYPTNKTRETPSQQMETSSNFSKINSTPTSSFQFQNKPSPESMNFQESYNDQTIAINSASVAQKPLDTMDFEFASSTFPREVKTVLELYEDSNPQIQRDPLLSEASSVIDAQKNLESARMETSFLGQANKSSLLEGQEWIPRSTQADQLSTWN